MHQNKFSLVLCLLGVAAGFLSACSKRDTATAADSSVLRLSQRNEPADLDPATASLPDEFFIIRALSEGLVSPFPASSASAASTAPTAAPPQSNPMGHFPASAPRSPLGCTPAAAERWETSADGLVYTFHLRPGALWSNGDPVTAQDFVASYRRLLTPATAAPKAPLFFMVKNARAFATGRLADFSAVGFRAADARTLVVTLARPTPKFLVYAASGPWIPVNPRVVAQFGRAWTRPKNFVGNGPFTLAEWRPHQRIVVKRNPRYRAAATIKLAGIDFLAFDSGDTEERAYRAGEVDVTMAVPVNKIAAYARERPAELHRTPLADTRYLAFNTAHPPLDDVRVRRALSLAIDRETLVDRVLSGSGEPAFRFVPRALRKPASARFIAGQDLSFDAVTARRLLAAAGFPHGQNFPPLELSGWPIGPPVLEVLQQMWKTELGIEVTLVTREAKTHVAALREGRYDIGFITAIPDVPDAANLLDDFTTGAPGNYPHWSDAHYDELVAAARAADGDQSDLLLEGAETELLNACPITPLYFNAKTWLLRPAVHGWREDALWTRSYTEVCLDEN